MESNQYEATELPPYRALMVVDMKNFSGEKGRDHARITEQIPLILEQTFIRCGLRGVWRAASFHGTTGDGYFAGFDPRHLPFLINPFLSALQDELEYQNRVSSVGQPMRMRVGLTVGPMTDSGGNAISDGSGDARIEAHRMIDDESVRGLLARSNNTTCVAGILSDRVYEDAVVSGYTAEDTGLYVPVDFEVKTYRGRAYLRVPKPSGDLLSAGFRRPEEPDDEGDTERGRHRRSDETGRSGQSFVGIEYAHGPVGSVTTGPGNRVNNGPGNQFNDVEYSGDGVAVFGTNQGGIQHRVTKDEDDR